MSVEVLGSKTERLKKKIRSVTLTKKKKVKRIVIKVKISKSPISMSVECTYITLHYSGPENHLDRELINYNIGYTLKSSEWRKSGTVKNLRGYR